MILLSTFMFEFWKVSQCKFGIKHLHYLQKIKWSIQNLIYYNKKVLQLDIKTKTFSAEGEAAEYLKK